ncbi:hypothetical protein [Priestia aryabhattai]|uniref:hypothetical protein n=1 Tax=Priestia aryabhattai TaxID=412384 RepID=UPI00203C916A|nr:hypothetical protein [Priestia aryabhattai]MCM3252430.1 hypothetical protein [Priestia aryabhattai]
MKSGNIEQFKQYSNFTSLKSFNDNIEMIMADYKEQLNLTKSELIAFRTLKRYCAKVVGVSWACVETIAKATELQGEPVSESTFHRMKRKIIKLGLIKVIKTRQMYGRHKNRQGANIWVFQTYKTVKKFNSQITKDTLTIDTEQPKSSVNQENKVQSLTAPNADKNIKTNNILRDTYKDNVIPNVPIRFQELAKFYYSPKQTLELWECVKHSTQHYNEFTEKYVDYDATVDKVELAISSFKQMIVNIKLGYTIKKSIFSYYYGIIQNKLDTQFKDWNLCCE